MTKAFLKVIRISITEVNCHEVNKIQPGTHLYLWWFPHKNIPQSKVFNILDTTWNHGHSLSMAAEREGKAKCTYIQLSGFCPRYSITWNKISKIKNVLFSFQTGNIFFYLWKQNVLYKLQHESDLTLLPPISASFIGCQTGVPLPGFKFWLCHWRTLRALRVSVSLSTKQRQWWCARINN